MAAIAACDSRVRVIRFARNSGAHTAITCGLHYTKGDCVVVMAADLQDPPETLPALLAHWNAGAQVVWAARRRREGEKASTIGLARLYYFLIRRAVGIREVPGTGTDFFLIDRSVVDAFRQFNEGNIDVVLLITWMGFRQTVVTYDKQSRLYGRSGWSLQKKLKLAVDSVTSFTYLPIRIMSYVGFAVAFVGFVYAALVIGNYFAGQPAPGWSSLMIVVLVVGGIQMLMMGVLGEYLWRALDESRRRPRYLIEATTEGQSDTIQRQSHG
jgi:dolichol-phosphate mannosyltransferase